jgi:hypothetical protein
MAITPNGGIARAELVSPSFLTKSLHIVSKVPMSAWVQKRTLRHVEDQQTHDIPRRLRDKISRGGIRVPRVFSLRADRDSDIFLIGLSYWRGQPPLLTHARASTGALISRGGSLALATMLGLFLPALPAFAHGTSRTDNQIRVLCSNRTYCGGYRNPGDHRGTPLRDALRELSII